MKNKEHNIFREFEKAENRHKIRLKDHDDLVLTLRCASLYTGILNLSYYNRFLDESMQLLKNAIFLYEDGYFDCAFYSIRQACECVDNMLFLANSDKNKLTSWERKKHFPPSKEVKKSLEKIVLDYKEIISVIPNFFQDLEKLIQRANKVIHKQGFDTFYVYRSFKGRGTEQLLRADESFFMELLKKAIGKIFILFVILDPISLALADDEIDSKIHYNLMTERLDVFYFNKFLNEYSIIDKIKATSFYLEFIKQFKDNEKMPQCIYGVIREEFFDYEKLDEIKKYCHLLNSYERFMLSILNICNKISILYYIGNLCWYLTTKVSHFSFNEHSNIVFESFFPEGCNYNFSYKNTFFSRIKMLDEMLIIQHDELLTIMEISAIIEIEKINTIIEKTK